MRMKKILSATMAIAMTAGLVTVISPATTASAYDKRTLIYDRGSDWTINGIHNYVTLGSGLGMTAGNKYYVEFTVKDAASGNPSFYFDWMTYNAVSKSNCTSWNYTAITGIYNDGSNDCIAIGTAPSWDKTIARDGSTVTYDYSILYDTAASKFDVTINYETAGGTKGTIKDSYTASGSSFSSGDVFRFASSGNTTIKDLKVYKYDYYFAKKYTTTGSGNQYKTDLNNYFTTGEEYVITWNMKPHSISNQSLRADILNGTPSGQQSQGNFGFFLLYDGGVNALGMSNFGTIGKVESYTADVVTKGVDFLMDWDTATGMVYIRVTFPTGKAYTYTYNAGVVASGQSYGKLTLQGPNTAVTVTDLSIRKKSTYTADAGWSNGAEEMPDGKVMLSRGEANATKFTPALVSGKKYAITYDVSGLATSGGSWRKPFTLSLSAGGQTESGVLTYRMAGAWRNSTTDELVVNGSNGQNKIVIDTLTGEWEAYALGTKGSYSGYTSNANKATKTYNAFSNTSDFTLNFYAYDVASDFDVPYISNVVVTEIYRATVSDDGNGSAQVSQTDNSATFTATADTGYDFDGWYNGQTKVSSANPYVTTLVADTALTAKFTAKAAAVTATTAVSGINDDGTTYKVGLEFANALDPSDYTYILFKVGDVIKGNTVEQILGTFSGDAMIAIILNNSPSRNVAVKFTNEAVTFE